jgi:hypothetical protein
MKWQHTLGLAVIGLIACAVAAVPAARRAAAEPGDPAAAALTTPQLLYFPVGSIGVDISWPQCKSGERPLGPLNFAIIGVNGGKMYTKNDCLADMWRWAMNARAVPQVYINTNGMPDGYTNPACAAADTYCNAYQYGYDGAAMAVAYATASGVNPRQWWLDVETGNYWAGDLFLNERVIRGVIEYLQDSGRPVGIYSTPRQFRIIAGGYQPGVPVWTAGAADLAEARTRCTHAYAFGGGAVRIVQYVSEHFDTNFVCPGGIELRSVVPGLTVAN